MSFRVFVDGSEGTTGLQIYDRLESRSELELLRIDPAKRKDKDERRRLMNMADVVFLCLPDAAAVEAVSLIDNEKTRVIDASTAHRTAWTYGFPELSDAQCEEIRRAGRVANPGCHASGFISVVYPLRRLGILPEDALLSCFSLTGYSGGGKKMISQYEAPERDPSFSSPRVYALEQEHKHLPEIIKVCSLKNAPVFCPVVADYYCGMAATLTLHTGELNGKPGPDDIRDALAEHYDGRRFVRVAGKGEFGALAGNAVNGTNEMIISVNGNDGRVTITSLFDNLGKGASGAAVQNMNIMLSLPEDAGL